MWISFKNVTFMHLKFFIKFSFKLCDLWDLFKDIYYTISHKLKTV